MDEKIHVLDREELLLIHADSRGLQRRIIERILEGACTISELIQSVRARSREYKYTAIHLFAQIVAKLMKAKVIQYDAE